MKKIIFVLVLIAVAAFTNQAFPMAQRPAAKKAAVKAVPEVLKITGRVSGYSRPDSTITVTTNYGSPVVISADKNTSISKAKKYIKLADINTGDYVTVTYGVKKGTNIAKSITVEDRSSSVPKKSRR